MHRHHSHPTVSQPSRTATPRTTPSHAASPVRRGLYAYVGHRVVELLTEQQLVDHAVSVLPQLQSVISRPHFHGPHWTTLRKKNGVDMFEFDPSAHDATAVPIVRRLSRPPPTPSSSNGTTTASSERLSARSSSLPHGFQTKYKLPNPGIDMAYAVVAQCELDGSVADVMDVLFNDDAVDFEASMKALWGNKLKRGDLLLSRSVRGRSVSVTDSSAQSADFSFKDLDELLVPEPGKLAIKTATVGAGLSLKRSQLGAEKLSYTSLTQSSPSTNDAFHVIKTLPLDVHDQIACGKTHVALRDSTVDHIAVGYHLTSIDSVLGGSRTRLVVCAYASQALSIPTARASLLHWHPRMEGGGRLSSSAHRESVNSDVRRIVMLLASAARDFQQIVRQRRFGNQRFVYFPTDRSSYRTLEQSCVVCLRRFGLFRKDYYCQLCGHLVCRVCSKKHKVESIAGKIRDSRMCFPCVARVDSGAFRENKLWKNMGRAVVVDSEVISPDAFDTILQTDRYRIRSSPRGFDSGEGIVHKYLEEKTRSDRTNDYFDSTEDFDRREIQVAHDLFSPHPHRRASALEALSRFVVESRISMNTTPTPTNTCTRGETPANVFKDTEQRRSSAFPSIPVATKSDLMQRFEVCYPGANPSASPSYSAVMPLLDTSEQLNEYRLKGRVSSLLGADSAAFDSICESVVQRLHFPVVFFVAQRRNGSIEVIGAHQAPKACGYTIPHAELAGYKPSVLAPTAPSLIVTEPMVDPRFLRFPFIGATGARFFAEFPLDVFSFPRESPWALVSLCALDTELRPARLTKSDLKVIKALCTVASDLLSSTTK